MSRFFQEGEEREAEAVGVDDSLAARLYWWDLLVPSTTEYSYVWFTRVKVRVLPNASFSLMSDCKLTS